MAWSISSQSGTQIVLQNAGASQDAPPSAKPLTPQDWLAQCKAQGQARPPVQSNNGPVPNGDSFDYFLGFVSNVKAPYQASDMGLMVVLVWWPQGTAAPAAGTVYLS